jgi:hypothetical protein
LVLFKDQLVSEASKFRQFYPSEELAEKIVDVINEQILPKAINEANLPEFPSPISLKREEFLLARSRKKAEGSLHEKTNFIHDLEKLRYQWNGSELTDVPSFTGSEETVHTTFQVFPKTELEGKQVEKTISIDEDKKQDVSSAPFKTLTEESKEDRLIDFDMRVAEKIVNMPLYAGLIGRLECVIREKYSLGKNFFSFSIRTSDDFPDREKTIITIDLPNTSFEQKMEFWKQIEIHAQKVIEHLDVTSDEKKEISRNLYTQIKV